MLGALALFEPGAFALLVFVAGLVDFVVGFGFAADRDVLFAVDARFGSCS